MRSYLWTALAFALAGMPAHAALSSDRRAMVWRQSWEASPAPSNAVATINPYSLTPTFENQTLVQTVRLSAGGVRLRIRLSNEYGAAPLKVGAVRVTRLGADGAPVDGGVALTFSGRPAATLPPGAPLLSDPVALPTPALATLRVAIFLPGAVPLCTCHVTGAQRVLISDAGDYTTRPVPPSPNRATYRAFLTGVEVQSRTAPVIVAFGDSITDGYRSTDDADRRWPDRLAERLLTRRGEASPAVVNAGLSGNRLLSDGAVIFMGQSALSRLDRDVLAVPGASHLIVLEGINDLGVGGASPPTPADLIAGYGQIIARAHAHGLKVIGATLLPYEGAAYFRAEGEAVRRAVNTWIRTSGAFDAVVDFDAVMRDPARPTRLRADLQSGDWLHPNDAGYRAMGDAIDLDLFKAEGRGAPGVSPTPPGGGAPSD